ncbi:hypothetical protein UFOVP587_13 [uncultured Caudovirales phage]|uniref:Uncharacterized protein n=1 Tax=uncultured Caudovirales phage TaxID=2100421 RepID=A0A6J5N6M9_9CAUD|nr:hypothetical protein UFOVP587_13 [uncultured Caudovirales phage]
MSEDFAPVSDVEPVGSTSASEVSQSEDSPSLDITEYSNYRVPVKFDGEEQHIPLSEAIAGYQRQADYTRKTQELAQQRESLMFASNLQTALDKDPAGTLELLSRHYGVSTAQAQQMMDSSYEEEDLDPSERRIRELDQRIASFEEYQSQQQIEKEISRLQTLYPDFDTNEVVQTALRSNTTDLEAVYKQLGFDKYMKQKELESQAAAILQQKENSVIESKREAAVVSGGSSATASTTTDSFDPITNIADAWIAAKKQLNANF